MSPLQDRKVYDSDLRDETAGNRILLRDIAHAYCRDYVGNFDLMIEAKALLARDGVLPEGTYRSVLNTLRTDPFRQDLWNAVQALLTTPEHVAPVLHLPPPKREYGGHKTPSERKRAAYLRVRIVWKVPFYTADRVVRAPVVHLFLREAYAEWRRPRIGMGDDWDLDMSAPLTVFRPRPRAYCSPWPRSRNHHMERPTYEDAFPGVFDPADVLMPFCRSCTRGYLEEPARAVYEGEVE